MVSPLLKNATASVSELMDGARTYLEVDPAAAAALQLAAVSKALAAVAPGEEPGAAAERLSVKWKRPGAERRLPGPAVVLRGQPGPEQVRRA